MKTSNTKSRLAIVLSDDEYGRFMDNLPVGKETFVCTQTGPLEFKLFYDPAGNRFSRYIASDGGHIISFLGTRPKVLSSKTWGMSEVEQYSIIKDTLVFVPKVERKPRFYANEHKVVIPKPFSPEPVTMTEFASAVETINRFVAAHKGQVVFTDHNGVLRVTMEF